jgi:hypothetical protein
MENLLSTRITLEEVKGAYIEFVLDEFYEFGIHSAYFLDVVLYGWQEFGFYTSGDWHKFRAIIIEGLINDM